MTQQRLSAKLDRLLDPERHPLAQELEVWVKYRNDLKPAELLNVSVALRQIAERATEYRKRLGVEVVSADVFDSDVVDSDTVEILPPGDLR